MADFPEIIPRSEMESWLAPLLQQRPWLAISVGILRNGAEQLEHFGACEAGSVFAIASITKTFTALALARLSLEGVVSLDAQVREYLDSSQLPPLAAGQLEITLRDLATHHSGLPRLPDKRRAKDFRDPFAFCEERGLYATLRAHGLAAPVAAKYEYSNFAYGVLGFALARAAGVTYGELIEQTICGPLGLRETTLADPPRLVQGRDLLGLKTPIWHFQDAMAGGGALRSTTEDVLRYLRGYLDPPPELAEAMALVQRPVHKLGDGGSVALGWHLNAAGVPWHNGALYGFSSFATFRRETGVAYMVLANQLTPPHAIADEMAANIGRTLRGEPTRPITGRAGLLGKYRYGVMLATNPLRKLLR
jgi:CubicO group peptidase (beta-lactamase class C family)